MRVRIKRESGVRFTIGGRDQVRKVGEVVDVRDNKYTRLMLSKGFVELDQGSLREAAQSKRTITKPVYPIHVEEPRQVTADEEPPAALIGEDGEVDKV